VENRLLLQQLLEGVGFEVHTAQNGKVGLTEYEARQPHLIWMDIRMPVMDGHEATHIIKASGGPETKIIAITASAFEEERAQILTNGCDDYLRKPFKEFEIFDMMAEHLGVKYVYETDETVSATGVTVLLAAEDLAILPGDWVVELRRVATRGRSEEIRDLIIQIAPQHPELAGALEAMVDDLAFTDIVALTQTTESHEQPTA
jgi:CheY-like chemotaxis protein